MSRQRYAVCLKCLFSLVLIFAMRISVLGQSSTATIIGTVEDTMDARIANATVKLISTDRGTESVSITNGNGDFSFPSVLPGHFKLQIERDGFDTTQLTDITLSVDESRSVIIRMKVGNSQQAVTVNGNNLTLDPLSTSIGQVQDQQAVRDLPLNTRNFSQLLALSSGAVPDNTQASGLSISSGRGTTTVQLNGVSNAANNYRVDNIDILDNHNQTSTLIYPPVEAIQEFRVISSVPDAEFGYLGATLNILYKSGTQALHGDVFEFLRNAKYLDAKNYFDPTGPIKPFHYNNYGATVGGPVRFPHFNPNHDKLFFFFSWEGARISQSLTYTSTEPLPAFANGDFSSYPYPIYDPRTTTISPSGAISRTAFPGNKIPSSLINQTGLNLLKLFPAPQNSAVVNNYTYTPATTNAHDYFDVRVDSPITQQDAVFLRFSHQNSTIYTPGSLPAPAIGNQGDYSNLFPVWQLASGYTRVIHPTLINEAHAGFTRLYITSLNGNYGQYLSNELGIPGANVPGDLNTSGLTEISLSGYGTLGDWSYTPASWADNNVDVNDSVTWVRGTHTFKFGGEFQSREENYFEGSAVRGAMSFGPTYTTNPAASGSTGNSLADLLLGTPTAGNMNFPIGRTGRRRKMYDLFSQDTWQVNYRLTLNFGLRWEYIPGWSEVLNRMAFFEIPPGGIYNVDTPQIPWRTGHEPHYGDFGPRIGFTYAATPHTLLRGAFGIYHYGEISSGDTNPPFAGSVAFSNDASNFSGAHLVSNGFARPTTFSALGAALGGIDPYIKDPMVMQMNLGIQQALPRNILFTVNYVGTLGRSIGVSPNVNQPTPGPGAVAAREPYPLYNTISYLEGGASSNYHSLQATLEKRMTRNIQFQASYTWSHALDDDSTPQNTNDLAAEYGNGSYNLPQRLNLSGVFALPFGRGMQFGSNISPLLDAVVGGWRLSTITNFYSGLPFTPTANVNTLNGSGTQRPNRIGSGLLPHGQQTFTHWFDTSAFVTPAQYQFGNSGRDILRGPDTKTADISLFKTFKVGKDAAQDFEFRADAFNITNTPQFDNPGSAIGSSTAGVISSAGSPITFQRTSRQMQLSGKFHF
jgi:Carboxypeptidase regulatory-like domain